MDKKKPTHVFILKKMRNSDDPTLGKFLLYTISKPIEMLATSFEQTVLSIGSQEIMHAEMCVLKFF